MKRLILIYIFILFSFQIIAAQGITPFNFLYGDASDNKIFDAVYSPSENAIFTVGSSTLSNNNHALVFKLDLSGNLIWTKSYFSSSEVAENHDVVLMDDGNLLVYGLQTGSNTNQIRRQIITKINAQNGDIIWNKTLTHNIRLGNGNLTKLKGDPNGETYIFNNRVLVGNREDWIIHKIDSDGDIIWEKQYDYIGNDDEPARLITLENGAFIVVGVVGQGRSEGMIVQFDTDGNQINGTLLTLNDVRLTHIISGATTSTGGYIFNGYYWRNDVGGELNHMYFKTDDDFNVTETNTQNTQHDVGRGRTIKDDFGFIYLERLINVDGEQKLAILKFTPAGDFIWSKYLDATVSSSFGLFQLESTGQLLINVATVFSEGFGAEDILLLAVDTSLNSCLTENIIIDYQDRMFSESTINMTDRNFSYNLSEQLANMALDYEQTVFCQSDEICDNGIDDDEDGLIDCADTDCFCNTLCHTLALDLGADLFVCDDNFPTLNPGSNFVSYEWQDGSSDSLYQTDAVGLYWVETVDSCGIIYADSIEISSSNVTIEEDLTICQGDSVELFGNFVSLAGIYTDTFINAQNCDSIHVFRVEIVESAPTLFTSNEDEIAHLTPIELSVENLGGLNVDNVVFSANDVIIDNQIQSSISYVPFLNSNLEKPQPINIVVEIRTLEGCIFNLERTFTITPNYFYMPNVFSPNGDGINDNFQIFTTPSFNLQNVQVYARWGELVFEGKEIDDWDFTFNGQKLEVGVYFVLITHEENGKRRQISSDFTIVE